MKTLGKAVCVLVSAILVMALAIPALASAAPSISIDSPREAMTGDVVAVTVSADGASSITADISTTGLELVSFDSDLCRADEIFFLRGFCGFSVTYTYRVTAQPGEAASFRLAQCMAVLDEGRVSLPDESATISVTGANVWMNPLTENLTFKASEGAPAQGSKCQIKVGTTEAGLSGSIEVSGLRFERVYAEGYDDEACLSTENSVILLRDSSGPMAVYEYTVEAPQGEPVSFRLKNVRMSNGDGDIDLPDAWWSATVNDHVSIDVEMVPDGETSYGMRGGYLGTLLATSDSPLTAGAMRQSIGTPDDAHVELYDAAGRSLGETDRIGTGCEARLVTTETGEVRESAFIVMRGDVTGSGTAGLSQMVAVARAFRGHTSLEGAYERAADWNANGRIDLADVVALAQTLRD